MTTDQVLDRILDEREGAKFTNDPDDRGGPTRWGITQATLERARGRPVRASEVAALTRSDALDIYRRLYVLEPGFDKIEDERLRALMVDSGVQHRMHEAVAFLQRAVGVEADGMLGPVTLRAVNAAEPKTLWLLVYAERQRYYGLIITNDWKQAKRTQTFPTQGKYAHGWANRMAGELVEFVAAWSQETG